MNQQTSSNEVSSAPATTTSEWNDRIGSRNRRAIAVIITADGKIQQYNGSSIPGVCQSSVIASKRDGKWSYSVYRIIHPATSVFIKWSQDFETGATWPQYDWDAGFAWVQAKAPAIDKASFEEFVRSDFPKTAVKWDAVAAAAAGKF